MKLATLVTNTDFSDFAMARPLDDAKFADLIAESRPDWKVTANWVCKGEFPDDLSAYDGVMVTGSPASVNDAAPWMSDLAELLRGIVDSGLPLFGACFGHQIIASALGSRIIRNPGGWAHGVVALDRVERTPWSGLSDYLRLYGSHIEQVADLPNGARRIFESPGCPIAGFAIGNRVFTVQHHPEMTRPFFEDLVEEYADHVGPEVTDQARRSIRDHAADRRAFAEEIAAFFETARH